MYLTLFINIKVDFESRFSMYLFVEVYFLLVYWTYPFMFTKPFVNAPSVEGMTAARHYTYLITTFKS